MPVLTDADHTLCAREMARRLFVETGVTATRTTTELKAIVAKIDEVMDATTNQMQTAYAATKVEAVLLQHARTAVAGATVAEVGAALAYWAMRRSGII